MNVLMVTDKKGSAIDRLAQRITENLPHINTRLISVHPKRPDMEQIREYLEGEKWADIIDFEYFRTAELLLDSYPTSKPKILAHYNPYSIDMGDWSKYDIVTVPNKTIQEKLDKSRLIPIMIDIKQFSFKQELTTDKTVLMVSGRIEAKKGVLPVAKACAALGYKLLLIGSVSDGEYMHQIMDTGCVEFREKVNEEELVKAYHESAIHVCNSIDNYESGTMPILEAMACGTPVLTRMVGHVPDFYNDENLMINTGEPEDDVELARVLMYLMENPEDRESIRQAAWQTVKGYDDRRRAVMYEKMWHELLGGKEPLVSVVIPTFNRKEVLVQCLAAVELQNWKSLEIVVADDGSTDGTEEMIMELRKRTKRPIKYVNTGTPDQYNLALARNLGVIEASGEIVVILDDRYAPAVDAAKVFCSKLQKKTWLFGRKEVEKDSFVENFSCIYRRELIDGGMFNTSVPIYGFQSQELRRRFTNLGFKLTYVPQAQAEILVKTRNKFRKRGEIIDSKTILWKMGLS